MSQPALKIEAPLPSVAMIFSISHIDRLSLKPPGPGSSNPKNRAVGSTGRPALPRLASGIGELTFGVDAARPRHGQKVSASLE